jgi:hypothetical protein
VNPSAGPSTPKSLAAVVQYDNVIPKPPAPIEGNSITVGGQQLLLSGVLGSQAPQDGTSIIVVGARDCKGRELRGGVVTLIDGATGQPVPTGKDAGQMHASYLFGGFPNEACTFTYSDQAIWAAVNAPSNMPGNTHPYTVRLTGRMHDTDTTPVVLGEKPVELWPNASIIPRVYRLTPP